MKPPPAIPQPQADTAKYVRCRVSGNNNLGSFITDLKTAMQASADAGGVYSAFLHLADGKVLQLEVALPTTRKDK